MRRFVFASASVVAALDVADGAVRGCPSGVGWRRAEALAGHGRRGGIAWTTGIRRHILRRQRSAPSSNRLCRCPVTRSRRRWRGTSARPCPRGTSRSRFRDRGRRPAGSPRKRDPVSTARTRSPGGARTRPSTRWPSSRTHSPITSTVSRGEIVQIATDTATATPGVLAVLHWGDVPHASGHEDPELALVPLADGVVTAARSSPRSSPPHSKSRRRWRRGSRSSTGSHRTTSSSGPSIPACTRRRT